MCRPWAKGIQGLPSNKRLFLQIKGSRGLYPKDFIEEAMAGTPGGMKIVMKGKHPNGLPLTSFGYRYSLKTMLFFYYDGGCSYVCDVVVYVIGGVVVVVVSIPPTDGLLLIHPQEPK
jgi:hypothetical protein